MALNLLLGGWKRRETSQEFETSMDYVMISEVRLSYRVSPYIKTTTTRLGAVDDLLALWY